MGTILKLGMARILRISSVPFMLGSVRSIWIRLGLKAGNVSNATGPSSTASTTNPDKSNLRR